MQASAETDEEFKDLPLPYRTKPLKAQSRGA